MSDSINVERYLERIGYDGPREPSVEALHALTAAHTKSIPFENIDVLLERPILLEPEALYSKLVVTRRGGYCFEQNGLFMEMLSRLGFQVRPLSAGVRLAKPDRSMPVGYTHLILEVRIGGEAWITDVGVGSTSLTCALRWTADTEQPTPHETRRLVQEGDKWFHQILRGKKWVDIYEFTGATMPRVERTIANWYTSTHPDSTFRHNLSVALAGSEGRRTTLLNHALTLRHADGLAEKKDISDPDQLLKVLLDHFSIVLPPDTQFQLNHRFQAAC
jgi:N-hydroxyarylamine O-acetyltransferase